MPGSKHIFSARRLEDAGLFVEISSKEKNRPAGGALGPACAVVPVRSVNGL
jgi:hypothetical protein